MSSLQNQSTGNYEHHGLSLRYGEVLSGQVLERSHCHWFEAWLGQSLAEKRRDLMEYWQSLGEPLPKLIESWLRIRPFRKLPPPAARPAETEQFLADCEVLLELFRIEYGVAAPDRDV
ncbi:MAG: hypothetical protein SFV54_27925 [Bryobacteraceae bacterium]|nr:hypothetical protein [Bryobacteraceae bacterium]